MSRRRRAKQRELLPDPKYNNSLLAKFINCLMRGGKKSIAERITYVSLESFATRVNVSPIEGFEKIINNVRPLVEVRSRRIGGATYQVPMEISSTRSVAKAIRWIIFSATGRAGLDMPQKLIAEFVDAFNCKGAAIKKREDTHKIAESNKAFAHYKW